MSDPISDMLTRIRNAVHGRHARVDMPASRLKAEIARISKTNGTLNRKKTAMPGGIDLGGLYQAWPHGCRE